MIEIVSKVQVQSSSLVSGSTTVAGRSTSSTGKAHLGILLHPGLLDEVGEQVEDGTVVDHDSNSVGNEDTKGTDEDGGTVGGSLASSLDRGSKAGNVVSVSKMEQLQSSNGLDELLHVEVIASLRGTLHQSGGGGGGDGACAEVAEVIRGGALNSSTNSTNSDEGKGDTTEGDEENATEGNHLNLPPGKSVIVPLSELTRSFRITAGEGTALESSIDGLAQVEESKDRENEHDNHENGNKPQAKIEENSDKGDVLNGQGQDIQSSEDEKEHLEHQTAAITATIGTWSISLDVNSLGRGTATSVAATSSIAATSTVATATLATVVIVATATSTTAI